MTLCISDWQAESQIENEASEVATQLDGERLEGEASGGWSRTAADAPNNKLGVMIMTQAKYNQRIAYLGSMLSKYAHRWGAEPNQRMYDWVDEFTELKQNEAMWLESCKVTGYSQSCDAYDLMA